MSDTAHLPRCQPLGVFNSDAHFTKELDLAHWRRADGTGGVQMARKQRTSFKELRFELFCSSANSTKYLAQRKASLEDAEIRDEVRC